MLGLEILLIISSLFGVINILKNSDIENYIYNGYKITFDSAGFCSFDNDTAKTVIVFGVDNISPSQSDNRKNNFLILGKGPTFGINWSFGAPEKKFDFNFSEANTANTYIIMVIITTCLLMEKKSLNLKLTIKMLTFQPSFVLEVFLMGLVFLRIENIFKWKCVWFFSRLLIYW